MIREPFQFQSDRTNGLRFDRDVATRQGLHHFTERCGMADRCIPCDGLA